MVGRRSNDPYLGLNFLVEIKGLVVGGFSEVSGLQLETEVEDYREGGTNNYIHKLAGPTRYQSNLILRHGITDSGSLWDWYKDVRNGNIQRFNISIILLNIAGEQKWRWDFQDAYPVRWEGPELRASQAEVAVETLELAHHGLIEWKTY